MTVLIPRREFTSLIRDDKQTKRKDQIVNDTRPILEIMEEGNLNDQILVLKNKEPQWSDQTHSYVLNFSGRVAYASVKNFQLRHHNDPDYLLMQFGRFGEDFFTMDLQYPLSPMLAFAIALTSFDDKMACE